MPELSITCVNITLDIAVYYPSVERFFKFAKLKKFLYDFFKKKKRKKTFHYAIHE